MCSSSRHGANNLVFVDGGTGGGSQKPKAKAKLPSDEPKQEAKLNQYNTDKKKGQLNRLDSDDYNERRDQVSAPVKK